VTRPLFERYREALRRGHLAVVDGQLEDALEAYREAAVLVPDRPLPHASIGTVLHQLGRDDEALAALGDALLRDPDDEVSLRARATTLEELGRAHEAADDLERLAAVLNADERAAAARGVAERAMALRAGPAVAEALPMEASPPESETGYAAVADPASRPAEPAVAEATEPAPANEAEDEAGGPGVSGAPGFDETIAWPGIDLPSIPTPLVGPPPDPAVLQAEADELLDRGEVAAARDLLLTAAAVHREAGRFDAAFDACLQLLAIVPGDPRVHLEIAGLQLDHGWRAVATEKTDLLIRLTSLSGETQAEADVHLLVADRL
jgi:tetratricopeptide (TPR) repeat protein